MSSLEKLGGLKQRLTVRVPQDEVEKAYQSRLEKTAKTAKLPGFQIPKKSLKPKVLEQRLKVVERLYGKVIFQEVASGLMQSSLRNAVEKYQLQIAGMPQIEMKEVLRGKPIEYVVNYEVYPQIKLHSLEGETVERLKADVTEKDIDTMLDSLRKQHAEWKEVEQAAQSGDRVFIDFEGLMDGKPFERGEAKDFELELGSKRMITGFEEGIEGMKVGENKVIDVTFPAEYPSEELAGKAAVFNIALHKVKAPELPPLDDQFAEKLSIKEGGLQALRKEIKKNMEKEIHRMLEGKLKTAVLDKLAERNPIEVPGALIEAEIDHLQQMTRQQIAMQTGKPDDVKKIELPREPYQEQAKKRVVLGLLLAEVIKEYKIEVDPDKVRARVEEIAEAYHKPEEAISWYYNNKKLLTEIESVILEDQAVDKLLSQLEVKEKAIPYEEAVRQAQ